MDAKKYLGIIKRNRALIRNKLIEKQYWLDMAEGTAVNMGGDRVQSSGNSHKMESKVIEAVLIDNEIERLKKEILDVIHTIERLGDSEYRFIHGLYVQEKPMKVICAEEGRSYSWATTTKRKSLKSLQKILDE